MVELRVGSFQSKGHLFLHSLTKSRLRKSQESKYIRIDKCNKNANNFKEKSNLVKWTSIKTGNIYYRYYNIYSKGELEKEVLRLKPEFKIIEKGYEKGNYYVKISYSNPKEV